MCRVIAKVNFEDIFEGISLPNELEFLRVENSKGDLVVHRNGRWTFVTLIVAPKDDKPNECGRLTAMQYEVGYSADEPDIVVYTSEMTSCYPEDVDNFLV